MAMWKVQTEYDLPMWKMGAAVHQHRSATRSYRAAPSPVPGWSGPTRASDADRAALVEFLGTHAGAGRLTLSEFEDRASNAYAATTLDDLGALVADLPAASTVAVRDAPAARGSRPPFASAGGFGGVLFVGAICVAVWGLASLSHGRLLYFWPMWVVGPWSIALLSRGLSGNRRGHGCSDRRRIAPR
jgi:hypothetical protein